VAANAPSYFNLTTSRYELEVAVQATLSGKIGEVGPGRINRPLRPLNGFDTVSNRNRTSPATDRETNTQLLERYKISIPGTQLATRGGLELYLKSRFIDAGDILVVNAGDPLVTRTGTNGNAVDIYITGSQSTSRSDNKPYIGLGQLIVLNNQPVLSITNVPKIGGGNYIEGTDFELVRDTSDSSGSIRAQDAIRFIVGGASPSIGDTVTINYSQDILVENIQNSLNEPDNSVGGQDPLIRKGTEVDLVISGILTVVTGFSFDAIKAAIVSSLVSYINTLKLGADIEQSDLQIVIRSTSGVDNFIFTVCHRVGSTGNSDVLIAKNEYGRITSSAITIV
jgi:hypothetical protein